MEQCWIICFPSGNSRPKEHKWRSGVGKETTTTSNHESLEMFLLLLLFLWLQETWRTHSGPTVLAGGASSTDAGSGLTTEIGSTQLRAGHWFPKELWSSPTSQKSKPSESSSASKTKAHWKKNHNMHVALHEKWITWEKMPWNPWCYMKKKPNKPAPVSHFYSKNRLFPPSYSFFPCKVRGKGRKRPDFWWKLFIRFTVFLYPSSYQMSFLEYLHTTFPIKWQLSQNLLDTRSSKCDTVIGSNYY